MFSIENSSLRVGRNNLLQSRTITCFFSGKEENELLKIYERIEKRDCRLIEGLVIDFYEQML